MGTFYLSLVSSFIILFLVNVTWAAINLYYWSLHGIQFLLEGMNFAERIYGSVFLKWIIILDIGWIVIALLFVFARRNYKTEQKLNYLEYSPIKNPKISMILVAFNEELAIEGVVKDFFLTSNSIGWGINPNNWIDLFIIRIKTGFFIDISVVSILGMGISWYYLKYFK